MCKISLRWPKLYADGVHMVMLDKDQNVVEGQIPFSITDQLDFEDGIVRKNIYDVIRYKRNRCSL